MGIEKIKELKVENAAKAIGNKASTTTQRAYLSQPKDSVSFTGAAEPLLKVSSVLTESLKPSHRSWINWMNSLDWLKGEIGGILITAIGTGLVAPVFIGFNPFVKAPKDATPEQKQDISDTKKYTAMRQPISAVLAIMFQASVQKYIDKALDKVFNDADQSKKQILSADQAVLNTDTYIKGLVKDNLKKAGETKPSFWAALFSKDARVKRSLYNEKFNNSVKEMQKNQMKELVDHFEKSNEIKINPKYERVLDNETMAEIINKQIDSYKDDAKNLMKSADEITYYAKKAEILITNQEYFKELANKLPLKEIENTQFKGIVLDLLPIKDIKNAKDPKVLETVKKEADEILTKLIDNQIKAGSKNPDRIAFLEDLKANPEKLVEKCENISKEVKESKKTLYKQLTDTVKGLYEKETNPDIKAELKRILNKPRDIRGNTVSRILQRIDSIQEMCKKEGGYSKENYIDAMLKKNNIFEERIVKLEECRIADPAKADKNLVRETIDKIAETLKFDRSKNPAKAVALQDTNTFGTVKEKLLRKVYEDVANVYKGLVKESYRSINQFSKIAVGAVITLPITCTALNWVYPRFMELFFPKLAGVKKAQTQPQAQKDGGDK